jgi:hypothetical protein
MYELAPLFPLVSIDNTPLTNTSVAYPCGLIAKYMFDDKYELYDYNNTEITID